MDPNILYFFEGKPEALPLYEVFEQKVFSEVGGVTVKVQKTQIAFANRRNFAFVSFLPVRKAEERPANVRPAGASEAAKERKCLRCGEAGMIVKGSV
ncbi:MAG: hypothetical protein HFI93_04395 [Lachnospiraceae bacterium]|nr:hypothetical protein [Lachnospiraceae bacterium]